MVNLRFTKMNGAGNDFIVADNRNGSLALTPGIVAALCDRHRGVGADGLLLVEPSEQGGDCRMRYYNADGSEADMCGNGARCFARYAARLCGRDSGALTLETAAGLVHAFIFDNGIVDVQLSAAREWRPDLHAVLDGFPCRVDHVNTGVPHAVVFLEGLDAFDVVRYGRALRYHALFAPAGANANFVERHADGGLSIRTYERGVENETLACGTGVVAAALCHHARYRAAAPVSVRVRGGDVLKVNFAGEAGSWVNIRLNGPADFVFDGVATIADDNSLRR